MHQTFLTLAKNTTQKDTLFLSLKYRIKEMSAAARPAVTVLPKTERLTHRITAHVKQAKLERELTRRPFYASLSIDDLITCAIVLTHDPRYKNVMEARGEDVPSILTGIPKVLKKLVSTEDDFDLRTDDGKQALADFKDQHASQENVLFLYDCFSSPVEDEDPGSFVAPERVSHVIYAIWKNEDKFDFSAIDIVERYFPDFDFAEEFVRSSTILEEASLLQLLRRNPGMLRNFQGHFDQVPDLLHATLKADK